MSSTVSILRRREIPMVIVAVTGVVLLAEYYVTGFTDVAKEINTTAVVLLAAAFIVGAVSIARRHVITIIHRTPGRWYYSVISLIVWAVMTACGIGLGQDSVQYRWLYLYVYNIGTYTFLGILLFYLFAGAYRSLIFRSVETTLFTVSVMLAVMAAAPVWEIVFGGPVASQVYNFVNDTIGTAAWRSINIGSAIGILALGVRTLAGKETSYLGA